VAGGGGWLGLIGWWSGDSGRGMSCLCWILPMTGSRVGMMMSMSGKKCTKYEARFPQIKAIPWSIKLMIPKNTARNKKKFSTIVATFTGVLSEELQVRRILKPSPYLNPSWPFCWPDRCKGGS